MFLWLLAAGRRMAIARVSSSAQHLGGWSSIASERLGPVVDAVSGSRFGSMIPARASCVGTGRRLAMSQAMPAPADEPSKLLRPFDINARNGSTVGVGAGPAARILSPSSNATNGAICATRREAGVTGFDCGAGVPALPALPHRPGGLVSI